MILLMCTFSIRPLRISLSSIVYVYATLVTIVMSFKRYIAYRDWPNRSRDIHLLATFKMCTQIEKSGKLRISVGINFRGLKMEIL